MRYPTWWILNDLMLFYSPCDKWVSLLVRYLFMMASMYLVLPYLISCSKLYNKTELNQVNHLGLGMPGSNRVPSIRAALGTNGVTYDSGFMIIAVWKSARSFPSPVHDRNYWPEVLWDTKVVLQSHRTVGPLIQRRSGWWRGQSTNWPSTDSYKNIWP